MSPLEALRGEVAAASAALREAAGAGGAGPAAAPTLERPKRESFGDYSTNAAMLLAPALRSPPREIAERLGAELAGRLGPALARFEVAGPGFLNLFLADRWYADALRGALEAGEGFGGGGAAARAERVLVEFVSANPTGPATSASGRHAAYGDALARILAFHGHAVSREYYVNDHGTQVERLGESIRARARHEPVPEGGYEGDYVRKLASARPDAGEADARELAVWGVGQMLERIKTSMHAFRVDFDTWFSERGLYDGSTRLLDEVLDALAEHTYESEGALWLRTSVYGDDKDRVLRRSNGEPTYFLSDVAHHLWKLRSGHERLIDVFGADHHGYVARMRAAVQALGGDPEKLEIPIMQFVHVVEGGARASMSKRRGDFVTLDDLVAEIGVDAARWFMLQRSHDTTVDLDLDLARSESAENPVYYVQYAHARIASVRRRAAAEGLEADPAAGEAALHPSERALVKQLVSFGEEVDEAAERRAPHRICAYALELAQDFTAFYRDCPVLKADTAELRSFRLALCAATQRTIATALDLLGVSAPEAMEREEPATSSASTS